MPASRSQPLGGGEEGLTPRRSRTNAFESGQQVTRFVLMPVGAKQEITLSREVVLAHAGAV
jgi:hypothetical protein